MTEQQLKTLACRLIISFNKEDKYNLSKNPVTKEIYDVAYKQHVLEHKFNLSLKILKHSDFNMPHFPHITKKLDKIYKKLIELNYEKSFKAMCCPLIEFTEENFQESI